MSQPEPPGNGDAMEQLRELLVGPERRDLEDLRRHVMDPAEKAKEFSHLLPHAVRLSSSRDAQLSRALAPTLESALKESVKRDPRILTDVVFPIIGPAIRRAIADAFSKMVQSLNQTMENSLSLQGLKWRIEAKRTGKTLAEVVLSRTLIYRVEQVFLIHKETGLLLAHAHVASAAVQDADMVSGMLTAIQDFMRDAFEAEGDGLRSTQYGDYNVWLESSRQITIAAFIRGTAPEDYRTMLREALERISIDQGAALHEFKGDAAPFEESRPVLEDCLREQRAESAGGGKLSPIMWITPLLLVAAIVGLWEWTYIRGVERRAAEEHVLVEQQQQRIAIHREQRMAQQRQREEAARLAKCVEQLNAQEGLVVTEVGRHDGAVHLTGLRDPLAVDPQTIIAAAGLMADRVVSQWKSYYALTPGIVLKRATQRLNPPKGVTLSMRGETLVATGDASGKWLADARSRVDSVPGVADFDASGIGDTALEALFAMRKAIEQKIVSFSDGSDLSTEQEEAAQLLAGEIVAFRSAASRAGRRVRITVTGHTTREGGDAFNLKLSRARAERIVRALVGGGVDETILVAAGVGAGEPKFEAEEDEMKNRCVSFRAEFEETDPGSAP